MKGLDVDTLVVSHIQVNQAQKQRRRTYRAHGRINRKLALSDFCFFSSDFSVSVIFSISSGWRQECRVSIYFVIRFSSLKETLDRAISRLFYKCFSFMFSGNPCVTNNDTLPLMSICSLHVLSLPHWAHSFWEGGASCESGRGFWTQDAQEGSRTPSKWHHFCHCLGWSVSLHIQ